MQLHIKHTTGQSIVEYSVILACIVAAFTAMHIYLKRGISGSLRNSADQIGRQYEPGYLASSITTQNQGDTYTKVVTSGKDTNNDRVDDEFFTDTYSVVGPDALVISAQTVIPADTNRMSETNIIQGAESVALTARKK